MKASKGQKVPVSERALLARINRKMAKDNEIVRRAKRDSRSYHELGDYYAVDLRANAIIGKHIDLEEWGREKGVLADFEKLETE